MHTTGTGAQMQPDNEALIRATIAPWNQACVDRNWDTLLSMCTEDVAFSGPGGPTVTGGAVRTWLENFPVQKALDWDFDRLEFNGNLGIGIGSGNMTLEVDGQEVQLAFDFTDVFRKSEDGRWLYSSVIFNENAPAG